MRSKKKSTIFYLNEEQTFLFKLICDYYNINMSKKVNEMIESFNLVYSHDFLNQSSLGKFLIAYCPKPWGIFEKGGVGGEQISEPSFIDLSKIDLTKMLEYKKEILSAKKLMDTQKIERFRHKERLTNIFEEVNSKENK